MAHFPLDCNCMTKDGKHYLVSFLWVILRLHSSTVYAVVTMPSVLVLTELQAIYILCVPPTPYAKAACFFTAHL